MAAANDEFFVKFKYWLVVGGIIILNACGITTNFNTWLGFNPIDAAASFWPLLTPCIPALTHSAMKVAVYKANDKVKAISSGGKLMPPSYLNEVVANCFNLGISNDKLTPPIKKLSKGNIKIKPTDIQKTGNCLPCVSWTFLAWILITTIEIIAAIIEYKNTLRFSQMNAGTYSPLIVR